MSPAWKRTIEEAWSKVIPSARAAELGGPVADAGDVPVEARVGLCRSCTNVTTWRSVSS